MTAVARQLISPEQYLEIERTSHEKHEYYAGQMYAMAGSSLSHSQISTNLSGEMRNRLKGNPFAAHGGDLRIVVYETGLYTYPVALVICGEPRFRGNRKVTVLNPTILFEVLSGTTEKYDRGDKVRHYRKIGSLKQFVMVSQFKPHVEVYSRLGSDWKLTEYDGTDSVMTLEALEIEVPLSEIYDRVSFEGSEDVLHE
jgi:Uma2 family endonuclease